MAPHTGILFVTQAQLCPDPRFSHPCLLPSPLGGLHPVGYQLELAPVNNIPLNPVHTTTNWPPSCSQQPGFHTTSPWEQLQLGNLFVVSQPSWFQPVAAVKQSGPPIFWHRPNPRILVKWLGSLFQCSQQQRLWEVNCSGSLWTWFLYSKFNAFSTFPQRYAWVSRIDEGGHILRC